MAFAVMMVYVYGIRADLRYGRQRYQAGRKGTDHADLNRPETRATRQENRHLRDEQIRSRARKLSPDLSATAKARHLKETHGYQLTVDRLRHILTK